MLEGLSTVLEHPRAPKLVEEPGLAGRQAFKVQTRNFSLKKMVGETPGFIPGFLLSSRSPPTYPFALPPVVWITTLRSGRALFSPS